MKKYRFRHLLEEKAVRENREITLADLSIETGIPCTDIKNMFDTSYEPPTDVLEKMARYFGCSSDELVDRTKEIVFDLATAFPKDDDLATDVISLLAATNDITFLQGLDLHYRAVQGTREKQSCEQVFVFNLAIGFLREGMKVFRRLILSPHARTLFNRLNNESKTAFEALKKDSDGEGSLYNTYLNDLRNDAAFHYHREPYSKALSTIRQKEGHFLVGLTPAESRFLVADDVRSEIFRGHIDFDSNEDEEDKKMERLMVAMGEFMKFARGFLIAYLEHRKVKYEVKN